MRNLLLLSNSTLHGSGYLEYAADYIIEFFKKDGVKEVLFIPYANVQSQANYTKQVRDTFRRWGLKVIGLNEVKDPVAAVNSAPAFFVGGGNTFHLLKLLQDYNLIEPIRRRVLEDSIPYLGSSAGTNVATPSISTTNDMPIVYPSSLSAIGLIPFNINPHFLDLDEKSTHKGETRDMRISEYHALPGVIPPVLGLREGSFLYVYGDTVTLSGLNPSRLFRQNKPPQDYSSGSDLSFLFLDPEQQ